jgi:hypothetical protein
MTTNCLQPIFTMGIVSFRFAEYTNFVDHYLENLIGAVELQSPIDN